MEMENHSVIAIGADHGGVALKTALVAALAAAGHEVLDYGTHGSESVDYPDFAHTVCMSVTGGQASAGILVCGTGIGMSIAANRHPAIRCALVHDVTTARLSRQHNDANILAIGARITGEAVALEILDCFLTTAFEGGRHARRIAKLNSPITEPAP